MSSTDADHVPVVGSRANTWADRSVVTPLVSAVHVTPA